MIQRKQTIFLLLAIAALIACIFLPVAHIEPKALDFSTVIYGWGMVNGADRAASFTLPSLVILLLTIILSGVTIFKYKARKSQAKLCVCGMILCLLWYASYAYTYYKTGLSGGDFHLRFAVCLPFVAIVLMLLARRGIMADERLVRSMDRIR